MIVALACTSASAAPRRGWLTGAGLVLGGARAVALSLGAYDAAQGEAAAHGVRAYYANGVAPTADEASTVRWLEERSQRLSAVGLGLLVSGAAAVVLGITLLFLDGWVGSLSVSLQPAQGAVRLSGTF